MRGALMFTAPPSRVLSRERLGVELRHWDSKKTPSAERPQLAMLNLQKTIGVRSLHGASSILP
jgi:hypothetical protein